MQHKMVSIYVCTPDYIRILAIKKAMSTWTKHIYCVAMYHSIQKWNRKKTYGKYVVMEFWFSKKFSTWTKYMFCEGIIYTLIV